MLEIPMFRHNLNVVPSKVELPKNDQLAWKMAEMASDHVPTTKEVEEMIVNRIIDNAAVALAAINRRPVANARRQALCHPTSNGRGATLFGLPSDQLFEAEWAAWANGTAVRELDMHDTFLAADYSHPGDNIPALLAVAQQSHARFNLSGKDLLRGIATAYEIQIDLVKAICLHKHKIDHIAHLCPAVAGGLGTMLSLDTDKIYQSIQQAVHVSFSTRQSRKGQISSWKAYAPAHAGKLGVEAVDRCMRGEGAPSPIYEGEDSVIAYMLDGPKAHYEIWLPEKGEPKLAILDSYTKEHSAEYQAQALIDLAFRMRDQIKKDGVTSDSIESIVLHTSHHTHYVIGTGAGDPQKMDPKASRETLDHSIMYIFAVALEDGEWHHVKSYLPERASRRETVALWHKISTKEDPEWTERYHNTDPKKKAFGARVEVRFKDGKIMVDELGVANANPLGAKPFVRENYINKFNTLTEGTVSDSEAKRFLDAVQNLSSLKGNDFQFLNVEALRIEGNQRDELGIF